MFSYYSTLCTEVYDLTKPVGCSLNGDIEYYQERLKTCQGRILEAAVGSGRFLIPLLEAGFTVDGIDYSPEMLHSCRTRCEERGFKPHLYEAELQSFSLPFTYEAIIIPTGSFCLLDKRQDSIDALTCFYDHLVSGGRLIVDLQLPSDWKTGEITTSTFALPNGDGITMENKSIEMDWLNQFTVSYIKYEKWRQGRLIETEMQRFALRWYGVEEFKLILERIGFSDVTCSADYVYGKQPTQADQIITFEAIRK
ncbi:class I SAM-dependent methyltransferase [Paenibacillus taiwanensis]|uniref:class I SAM-dependent methyltransferase n=1 Tax=Paenibacillus taiwanensis TaxID=401638 RepID=UPI0004225A14|nr:class I SAM-dependent methyltransferase [Paenibacillus taiwanensis]